MTYLQCMKIFSAEQFRNWDAYTIIHEPISSIDLMERAARECVKVICKRFPEKKFVIFCGPGNNGGDGLAIGRMLLEKKIEVEIFLTSDSEGTGDYKINLRKIERLTRPVVLKDVSGLSLADVVIIDAMFGTGLNKAPNNFYKSLIDKIDNSSAFVISIDIPSGMFADRSSKGNAIIQSGLTLTFQRKKPAFFMPENSIYTGEVQVLNIQLSVEYELNENANYHVIDKDMLSKMYRPRDAFTHKGNYGYACLIAGSRGMIGAAILSTIGCLRTGAGKVACHTCETGYSILQSSIPEALCTVSGDDFILQVQNIESYDAIGIGPGMGEYSSHHALLENVFTTFNKPMVVDADALNTVSQNKSLLRLIPAHSILTPHPKEFERLFGRSANDFDQRELASQKAAEYNVYIILKGRYTCIATPEGEIFVNETGNPGMATGGSGDVLTGILTGLLAQKYSPKESCILGVFLHGLAGDLAAAEVSQEALIAGDICKYLGKAFLQLKAERQVS